MNLKKIKQNKYNYNYDLKANESNKKNFNFQKSNLDLNDEVEHKNQINRIARLKKLFLNIYRKDELVNKNDKNIEKQEIKTNNDINDNSKYLLTTLKKMNGRNKTDDLLEINKDKILLNSEKANDKSKNKIYQSFENENLKINLPGINKKKQKLNKSTNYTKIKEANNQDKSKKKQKNKFSIKKENSKSKFNIKKARERDINRLYSTISTNSNFLREYPLLKITNYFKKYKKINIKKFEPEKGSNLFPILDSIENIAKNQDISKLAKSLDETKEYLTLKKQTNNKRILNDEKVVFNFDKVNENENIFPLIKYDCAEKIIFGKKNT